eukprot:Blabericola_migrator_1__1964@NODE_1535_length_4328_cov_343_829148_g1009_i0_p3_GENE_NODE_1535_length_4328_cov_343_829148_g1009_i0NODE_1535_length_4328_cov_343_829148_g1009_i0_p3_ORF_typecomplete_len154_score18_94DUF2069/PF09842_9/0_14DUF2069/PF09842_9/1_8e03_NODE_1535_length_4328_cov_343_829148_g1009_i013841845
MISIQHVICIGCLLAMSGIAIAVGGLLFTATEHWLGVAQLVCGSAMLPAAIVYTVVWRGDQRLFFVASLAILAFFYPLIVAFSIAIAIKQSDFLASGPVTQRALHYVNIGCDVNPVTLVCAAVALITIISDLTYFTESVTESGARCDSLDEVV